MREKEGGGEEKEVVILEIWIVSQWKKKYTKICMLAWRALRMVLIERLLVHYTVMRIKRA